MCGICGFISIRGDLTPQTLVAMNATLQRRGPDDEGIFSNGAVGLAMRRLAIIDPTGGRQPIANESGDISVVFNGAIYNYRQLRRELERKGHCFRTSSDTEVIVHLYEEYGSDVPLHLQGMFAFAIWDSVKREVVLGRDRFGIKPLYIATVPQGVLFGSEIKALLATGLVPADVDTQALDEYLTYTFVPTPRTIYRAIRQVPPGSTLTIGLDGRSSTARYWTSPRGQTESFTEREWLSKCEAAMRAAVGSHVVSDVPVGVFLSGGVDSGLIAALMADATEGSVDSFSVGFGDAGASFIDERPFARQLAKRYGLKHHEIDVTPNFENIIWDIVDAFDQPFADDSVIPSYFVSQHAAKYVKVALTGLGGDELFGGYRRHQGLLWGETYGRLPEWLRSGIVAPWVQRIPESPESSDRIDHLKRFVRQSGATAGRRYQDMMSTLPWSERSRLYAPAVRDAIDAPATSDVIMASFDRAGDEGLLQRALRTDIEIYMVDDILALSDRIGMWHSLELRVPFLDHRLVDLTSRIPRNLKIRGRSQKYLLKRLAERWLPPEMIHHRKQGFEAPMGRWLRGPLVPLFDSIVSRRRTEACGLLNYDEIVRLRDEHIAGRRKHSKILFSILMLHAWQMRNQPDAARAA